MEQRQAVIYLRRSRAGAGSEVTLPEQERLCREEAARRGLEVRAVFNEGAGRSAWSERAASRPQWQAMLGDLGPGDVVLARDTERLSRDEAEAHRARRAIHHVGASIVTLDGVDTSQPGSGLSFSMRVAFGAEESEAKSRRLKQRKEADRRAGRWTNGRPPYGYEVGDNGKLRRHPERAAVVRRMVESYLGGGTSNTIARELNAAGVPTTGGTSWSPTTVGRLLRNPALVGELHAARGGGAYLDDEGLPISITDEPLVSRSEWLAMEKQRASGAPTKRKAGRPPRAVLSGLLTCSACGGPMTSNGRTYGCQRGQRGLCAQGASVTMALVEDEVARRALSRLAALEPGDPVLDEVAERWTVLEQPGRPTEARDVEAKLAEVRDREARVIDAIAEGVLEGSRAKGKLEELKAEESALQARLAELAPPSEPDIGVLLDAAQSEEAWAQATRELRRQVLHAIVEGVEVRPIGRGRHWDPSRITVAFVESEEAA